jgi:hypothetical protein
LRDIKLHGLKDAILLKSEWVLTYQSVTFLNSTRLLQKGQIGSSGWV